jgi:transposase-like protein
MSMSQVSPMVADLDAYVAAFRTRMPGDVVLFMLVAANADGQREVLGVRVVTSGPRQPGTRSSWTS